MQGIVRVHGRWPDLAIPKTMMKNSLIETEPGGALGIIQTKIREWVFLVQKSTDKRTSLALARSY